MAEEEYPQGGIEVVFNVIYKIAVVAFLIAWYAGLVSDSLILAATAGWVAGKILIE